MPAIGKAATEKIAGLLSGDTGLPYAIGALQQQEALELPLIESSQVLAQQIAFDMAEKKPGVSYPAVYVYCQGLRNELKEKFRTFSGTAEMAIEVRVSYDHLGTLSRDLELYTAAISEVLDSHRGDWGGGMFYSGGYKVEFGPVKRGGRDYLQIGKVTFEVQVSY